MLNKNTLPPREECCALCVFFSSYSNADELSVGAGMISVHACSLRLYVHVLLTLSDSVQC